MNSRAKLAASLVALVSASAALAQVPVGQVGLIAGFDFANYNQINRTTLAGQNGVQAPHYEAFFSDVTLAGDRGAHSDVNSYVSRGRIVFTGSPVSDNWTGTSSFASNNNALVTANDVAANSTVNTFRRNNSSDTLFSRDLIGDGSETNAGFSGASVVAGLELKPGQVGALPDSISFAFNTSGFEDIRFSMGAQLVGLSPTVTISWSYSINGVDVISTGLQSVISSTTAAAYSVDLSNLTAVDNTSEFYLVANFTTTTGSHIRLDNVQLTGTAASAIPEPSSFAALAGLAGLGFAALRRRQRAA